MFLDDVFVPDDAVLGGVNRGWGVAMATTGSERGLTLRSPGRFLATADRLIDLYRRTVGAADAGTARPRCRRLDRRRGLSAFTLRTVTASPTATLIGAESSVNKSVLVGDWTCACTRRRSTCSGSRAGELDGPWMRGFEFSLAGPIYAGTNEIQRNVVAERVLGSSA